MITALIRTIILYFLIMAGLRLMGKRQIGELEPSELVLALLISDLAAVPMQDFGIPLINGVFPILTLLSLAMILSVLNLKSIPMRNLICGSPTMIIRDGHVLQDEMRMSEAQNNYISAHYNYRVTNLTLLKLTGQTESLLE